MQTLLAKRVLPLAAAFAVAASAASAQSRAPGAPAPDAPAGTKPGEVQITELTSVRNAEQKAPSLNGGVKKKKWGVFDVSFQTTPEWIDEISVTYTVMLQTPPQDVKNGAKPFSSFRITVSYPDIARDRDHKVGAVMLPAALRRYGKPVGFAAQMFVDGKEVAAKADGEGILKNSEKWWENKKILEGEKTQRREGYLIDRMKSPFQLQDADDYEESR